MAVYRDGVKLGLYAQITITADSPALTLLNNTAEDTEGGRESKIIWTGTQSGGEESTLAQIQGSHDGASDDEKGDLIFSVNDGNDGTSPTEVGRVDSAALWQFILGGTIPSWSHSPTGIAVEGISEFDDDLVIRAEVGSIAQQILRLYDTRSQAAGVGAAINLGGIYTGTTVTELAAIGVGKENAIAGQYGGYLWFAPRANGSPIAERMRLTAAGVLEIHDGSIPSWGHSPTGLAVEGLCEFDGAVYFDSTVDFVAASIWGGGYIRVNDDLRLSFGTSSDVDIRWETADPNAHSLHIAMPEGGATSVPVAVFGDQSIENVNLGFFDGITEPRVAVVDDDGDSWIAIGFSADDTPFIGMGGVAAAADYTTTNVSVDRAFDADTVAVAELADVVGTLIADMISLGLLQ